MFKMNNGKFSNNLNKVYFCVSCHINVCNIISPENVSGLQYENPYEETILIIYLPNVKSLHIKLRI